MRPGYTHMTIGELQARAQKAGRILTECTLCPRQCRVNRRIGQVGFCRTGDLAVVASAHLHFGEEAPLVGSQGSGTIFFAGCNLGCVFCQNFDISHGTAHGHPLHSKDLAAIMLNLQDHGAHNINLVTPSHVVPQILAALPLAVDGGLNLPLVYNSSGYDALPTLRLLEGIVDIYMPDTKFFSPQPAEIYCQAADYPQAAREALREMHRQVGDLVLDEQGRAVRGLLVRHLLMPGDLTGSEEWFAFLAEHISRNTYLNIMDQYRPCGDASLYPELRRPLPARARSQAVARAKARGLTRIDPGPDLLIQDLHKLME